MRQRVRHACAAPQPFTYRHAPTDMNVCDVLPQVFQDPLCKRHYASIFSIAFIFRLLVFSAAVVLAFLIAYASGGFWERVAMHTEQPTVHYSGDALAIFEVWHALIQILSHHVQQHLPFITCLHGLLRRSQPNLLVSGCKKAAWPCPPPPPCMRAGPKGRR